MIDSVKCGSCGRTLCKKVVLSLRSFFRLEFRCPSCKVDTVLIVREENVNQQMGEPNQTIYTVPLTRQAPTGINRMNGLVRYK